MRYSLLVHLSRMANTLQEAAQYLGTPESSALREALMENGRQMLSQMKAVLEGHADDLKSSLPLERLIRLEELWERAGEDRDVESLLGEFAEKLPGEVRYQVRAVFFAELGEKWDAMESVYAYMRDDPRFDPVVVLTPVFRIVKQPDGTTKQDTIYKDYLTPLGIPFLHYQDYDIEKDCPELAFTSQPYESCTLPQFWAENIAKHTRLVYLFYYLPSFVVEDFPTAICRMPIYNFAWKIIGSNEKHYQYYKKYSYHNGVNMLVTGLPKADALVDLKTNGVALPEGWKKLSGKKVFLWNSWFGGNCSLDCYFDTIVGYFKEHSDCALIWRPHPMTDTVTKLYYPGRYNEYLQRLHEVDHMPNAVVDRELSYKASFYYSDAQISDFSSLMVQYLFVDKPLLWMKNSVRNVTGEEFISGDWIERAFDKEGIIAFLERTRRGEDMTAALRKEICQRELPFSDGRCGERVCNVLYQALHEEDRL